MQQTIISFFRKVLQQDKKTLSLISDFQDEVFFEQDNTVLVFSIKGLHQLLDHEESLNYTEFRKQLYQSNLNEALQEVGGKVDLHQPTQKVDESLYKLIQV